MKIATHNISGGFFKDDNTIDFFDKKKSDTIDNCLLNELIKIINEEQLDVVCFQEIITTEEVRYIESIINNTALKYYTFFELSPCHVVENTDCGLAILSRTPIEDIDMRKFTNPKLAKQTSSGKTYYTFDKGCLTCTINGIKILTHHGFPYRRFNSTPEANLGCFKEFDMFIQELKPDVITGDFNTEKFIDFMDYTRENYMKTIDAVTTVDNMKFDNILVKENSNYNTKIVKSLSDHFMVIADI